MKASAFAYVRATTLADALALLARHGEDAKVLAGGQSLVPALNLRLMAPGILVDINPIDDLKGIDFSQGRLRIGALTRHVELARSPEIAAHAPLLPEAVRHVAHPAIRNRGTLGGNLAHADPASELPACMVALDASFVVAGPGSERRIRAEDFFTGIYETALAPGELLVAAELPERARDDRHGFVELARRSGDYALVGIALCARAEGRRLTRVRPVFFAAGPKPILAAGAAAVLEGREVTDAVVDDAVAALAEDLEPADDLQITAATRLHLAGVALRRSVGRILAQADAGLPQRSAA